MESSLHACQAYIFDADGTLLDSMGMWHDLDDEYLAGKGIACTQEIKDRLHDMFLEECPAYFRSIGVHGSDEEIYRELDELSYFHYLKDIFPKPGVKEFLRRSRQRGIAMCIATASPKKTIEDALCHLGLQQYIDFVTVCAEIGTGKNDPAIFLHCAQKMGVPVQKTAVFEDSLYAALTAKKAGFYLVGVADPFVTPGDEKILRENSDIFVDTFEQLPRM